MADAPFLVLAANTPWVFALANALSETRATTAMRFYDMATWYRLRPKWPAEVNPALRCVMPVMPPGFAGTLEPIFRPAMGALINAERRRLRRLTGIEPYVIAPFPYLQPWLRNVPTGRLLYYSLDEYSFYDPARTALTHRREDLLVGRAIRTLCLSHYQADVLGQRNPTRTREIRHFPLGVDRAFINPAPDTPPQNNLIGYVGTLGDRVDWPFVEAVAVAAPALTFEFVGSVSASDSIGAPHWEHARARAFALPNVYYTGSVPQAEVKHAYWRSAVNWMPYDIAHGFNLAACPTKIMDAIASGRPFVSTDVPECRLYPNLIQITNDHAKMAAILTALAANPRPDPKTLIDFAQNQTWSVRARTLLDML